MEAQLIRKATRDAIAGRRVDGLIVAGDLNLVGTALPLGILGGPYGPKFGGLAVAEVYQLDGQSRWTWDGRETPFPSNTLDYALFSATTLEVTGGWVLDTADVPEDVLDEFGLSAGSSGRLSSHLPLVVDYRWR